MHRIFMIVMTVFLFSTSFCFGAETDNIAGVVNNILFESVMPWTLIRKAILLAIAIIIGILVVYMRRRRFRSKKQRAYGVEPESKGIEVVDKMINQEKFQDNPQQRYEKYFAALREAGFLSHVEFDALTSVKMEDRLEPRVIENLSVKDPSKENFDPYLTCLETLKVIDLISKAKYKALKKAYKMNKKKIPSGSEADIRAAKLSPEEICHYHLFLTAQRDAGLLDFSQLKDRDITEEVEDDVTFAIYDFTLFQLSLSGLITNKKYKALIRPLKKYKSFSSDHPQTGHTRATTTEKDDIYETENFSEGLDIEEVLAGMREYLDYEDDNEDAAEEIQYTVEDIEECGKILAGFQWSLSVCQGDEHKIRQCVKEAVLKLNELNEKCDHILIETEQREDICEFIFEHVNAAGLDTDEDITEEWREW